MVYEMRPTACDGGSMNMIRQIYSTTVENMRTCCLVDKSDFYSRIRSRAIYLYSTAYVINL